MSLLVRGAKDEREGLVGFLTQQRLVLRIAAHGLTDEQARLTPTAGTLSVGGLIKHLGFVEHTWMDFVEQRPMPSFAERAARFAEQFVLGPEESLAGVLARYAEAAERTDAVVAGLDLDHPVPVPQDVPLFPKDLDAWPLRWVLFQLIQETARHAGHADIVRESIDGATALPLMAAAENWPAMPGVQPWQPKSE
jgi:hypothetical protein